MRYLGMDYGSKTLGLSISDRTGLIAGGYKTLRYENILKQSFRIGFMRQ